MSIEDEDGLIENHNARIPDGIAIRANNTRKHRVIQLGKLGIRSDEAGARKKTHRQQKSTKMDCDYSREMKNRKTSWLAKSSDHVDAELLPR